MKGRILILGTGHISTNPRVLKEAIALAGVGYWVSVIGKRHIVTLDSLDKDFHQKSGFNYNYIDMVGGHILSPSYMVAMLRRGQVRIARYLVDYCRWQSAEALGPAAALLQAARRITSDLVIVHNEAAQWAGLRLIAEGRRVAVDFEDWNSESLLPTEQEGCPLSLLRRNEKAILHQAVYTTTTSKALAQGLFARYGGQLPEVITNSFPLPSLSALRQERPRNPPSFFWVSQTIGPGRGLEAFLAAYALTKQPSRLTLLGQIRDDYRLHLLSLLPESRRQQLSFHELVSPEALPNIIAQHDIGLALEPREPANKDLTISNKILHYLGAGLAIVATPTQGQREVLSRKPFAGILLSNLDDARATAAALDELLADPDTLLARQQVARQLAETHYCWEREAPRLLELVKRALQD